MTEQSTVVFNKNGTTDAYEARREAILSIASTEATKWGLGALIIAGSGTALMVQRSKNFRQFTSISIKVAIPVMACVGTWSLKYELVLFDCARNPEKWGLTNESVSKSASLPRHSTMPLHHRFVNYLHDHPYQLVAGMGSVLALAILKNQMQYAHLTLSQKIMHSRVLAQGGVLTILLSTMAFTEYMDKVGRFPDPENPKPQKD